MSYQRLTEGDAYVIGTGGMGEPGTFECVGCTETGPRPFRSFGEIIAHLRTAHDNSAVAIERLEADMQIAGGPDRTWTDRPGYKPSSKRL